MSLFFPGRLAPARAALLLFTALAFAQPPGLAEKSRQAKELMAAGRFADAIPLYEDLCRGLSANTGLRLNLGLAYHMAGRPKDAIPAFERVLQADPASLPALLSLGTARLQINDPARAIPPLEKAVALQPANVDARGMLANALLSQQRAREAAVHFKQLTTLTPQDPKAWYGLGRSYETLSAKAFDDLTKSAPGSAGWLVLVAETRLQRRQYRSAFYFYKEAQSRNPKLRDAHTGLAEVYRRTNHPEWAEAEMKKAAALPAAPPSRVSQYNQLALQAFTQLGKLEPSVEMHALKAESFANHGQHMEAAQEWRDALKLAPADPRLERELAAAVYLARDYEQAIPLLEAQLARDPRSPELNFFLGDSLLRLEQPAKAVPHLETAVTLDPKLLPARASMGMTYARANRPADAIPHLLAALSIDDDGSLHYQLARAYQSAGDPEKSKQALAEYQAIQQRNQSQKSDLEEKTQITPPNE